MSTINLDRLRHPAPPPQPSRPWWLLAVVVAAGLWYFSSRDGSIPAGERIDGADTRHVLIVFDDKPLEPALAGVVNSAAWVSFAKQNNFAFQRRDSREDLAALGQPWVQMRAMIKEFPAMVVADKRRGRVVKVPASFTEATAEAMR